MRVILLNPIFVIPARDIPHPVLVVEIPLDGFADAGLEAFRRFPTELAVDFCGVDGVAAVVARAVGDEGDLVLVELAIGAWREFVEECANGVHDIKVRFFIPTADVVGLAHAASLQHAADGGAVVAHIEPVADLLAVAVDGERFSSQGIVDDQRDEFFWKMQRAIVVRAIRSEGGEPVGVVVGAHEVVAGGLAGGIGTVRLVGVRFAERRVVQRERAVYLIGGYMQEAEGFFRFLIEPSEVGTDGFEKVECADDVCLNELARAVNRAVHMRLGGEVHDSTRLVLGEDFADKGAVADIASNKDVARAAIKRSEILWIAGVGELVEVDDGCGLNIDPVKNEVGPDKTGTAGDEDGVFHKFRNHEISRIYTNAGGPPPHCATTA